MNLIDSLINQIHSILSLPKGLPLYTFHGVQCHQWDLDFLPEKTASRFKLPITAN